MGSSERIGVSTGYTRQRDPMPTKRLNYGPTAKVFHWVIVALLIVQLPLGWLMPGVRRGMAPGTAMSLHISIGMTVLVLIVLRFVWRLTHPVAPLAAARCRPQRCETRRST